MQTPRITTPINIAGIANKENQKYFQPLDKPFITATKITMVR